MVIQASEELLAEPCPSAPSTLRLSSYFERPWIGVIPLDNRCRYRILWIWTCNVAFFAGAHSSQSSITRLSPSFRSALLSVGSPREIMKIVFRTDASLDIGTGHVMRAALRWRQPAVSAVSSACSSANSGWRLARPNPKQGVWSCCAAFFGRSARQGKNG